MHPDIEIWTPPNGKPIALVKHDTHISKWVKQHRSLKCDPALFDWLKPYLKDVDVVWDIGANIGDHTRFYLDEGKTVVAVEANPVAHECLVYNCPEAVCLNVAASDSEHYVRLVECPNVGASHVTDEDANGLRALPMDSLGIIPQFIKMDIEGYEYRALKGMEKTLRDHHPKLFIEINRGALERAGTSPEQVKQFLVDCGYTQFIIHPDSAREHSPQYDLLCL